jgi:hypothetical protein
MSIRKLSWDKNTKDSVIVSFDASETRESSLYGVAIGPTFCVFSQWYTFSPAFHLFSFHIFYSLKQALNFVFKDRYEGIFANFNPKLNPYKFSAGNLFAGGVAGISTLLFTYPLDFARTRLSVDIGKSVNDRQFRGINDCLVKIGKADGIRGWICSTKMKTEASFYVC